eukprot:COSAG05_NODE_410_length_10109_cov_29.470430_8_plen_96_part_00
MYNKNYKLATACTDSRRIRAKLYEIFSHMATHGSSAEFWPSTLIWLLSAHVASRVFCSKTDPVLFVFNLFYLLRFTCNFVWVHFQKSYDCALFLH